MIRKRKGRKRGSLVSAVEENQRITIAKQKTSSRNERPVWEEKKSFGIARQKERKNGYFRKQKEEKKKAR